MVITLSLKREDNAWLATDEAYIEAARLRKEDGQPVLLEIRAEHLKDYLCARSMALRVSSYRNREEVAADGSHVDWPASPHERVLDHGRWEGRKTDIHEGGKVFGASTLVMHMGREKLDFAEDVPKVGPFDESLVSKSWTVHEEGQKLTRISGELWRDEWVEPGQRSPRARGDKLPSSAFFIVDASGSRCPGDELERTGGWLWFRPELIMTLLNQRGADLTWYTRDTGGIRCSPSTSHTNFGVNRMGLVNIYAKDMILLPLWIQTIWAGFNITPEGGVSDELFAAQAAGTPADTQAPEKHLPRALNLLNKVTLEEFAFELFRPHEQLQSVIRAAHRFRSTTSVGFFSLAKDLARLTADSIDAAAIQKVISHPKGEKWGSLKSLEHFVALSATPEMAHKLLSVLVGTYELRHGDAHLKSHGVEAALELVLVDRDAPPVTQGRQLLHSCVSSLYAIATVLRSGAARKE